MSKASPIQHIPSNLSLSDEILKEAASRFGTPLYIYDAHLMQHRWNLLSSILPEDTVVYYSVKANPNIWIIDAFQELGASFEVASAGELTAALRAGVSPTSIIFVGPGKSRQELEDAVARRLGAIVAESRREVKDLQVLSRVRSTKTRVVLRVNPGRGRGMISMGGATQFGMEPHAALDVLINTDRYSNLEIIGLHAYLGTGILDLEVLLRHTHMVLQTADELQRMSGKELEFIDVGGGLGIPYYSGDEAPDWQALTAPLCAVIDEYRQDHPGTDVLAFESGRFLVGPSGVFLTQVLYLKESQGRFFAVLDGGTSVFGGDDPYRGFRPTPVRVLARRVAPSHPITLCGPLCTTADRLAVDTLLPVPDVGDLVAFYQAGAYKLTASPGLFLSHGFPCEILMQGDRFRLIRKRTTPDQFLASQPEPPRSA